jgi:hypothetical protein
VLIFYFYFIFIFFVELLVLLVFTRWLSVQFSISKAYAAIHLCCVGIKFFHGDISIYLRLLEMVCVSTFFMSIFVWYDIYICILLILVYIILLFHKDGNVEILHA